MRVFLIRHGLSQDAEESKSQSPDSSLSKMGRKQVSLLAKRLKTKKVDVIFSSHWPRAIETAMAIAKHLGKKVEISKLIHEREKHPSIYGIKMDTPEYANYLKEITNSYDLDWKYKGSGESIRDIVKRAIKFRSHLVKNHSAQNIAVVTHGNFIRAFIGICTFGEVYDDGSFLKFYMSFFLKNTGISQLEYDEKTKRWLVLSVNDFSHLSLV